MSEHTPGPWAINDTDYGIVLEGHHNGPMDEEFICVLEEISKVDARRIVSCVNALEGMETAEIESLDIIKVLSNYQFEVWSLIEERKKLQAENERLWEAGNKMARFISTWQDCLEGVQMSEDDFNKDCGLSDWLKARAALGKE
jgi:hypothetical protein